MAAWKTFRLTLDLLVKAGDAEELPDADALREVLEESVDELSDVITAGLLAETESSLNIKAVRELQLPNPPPYEG